LGVEVNVATVLAAAGVTHVCCDTLLLGAPKAMTWPAVGAVVVGWKNSEVNVAVFGPIQPQLFVGMVGSVVFP
jgi:hypothetical protein